MNDAEDHSMPETVTSPMSQRAREIVAYIKETGATGISVAMVAFFLSQQAGWVPNADRDDHRVIVLETQRQTLLLSQNQELMKAQFELFGKHIESTNSIARSQCFIIPKLTERERTECVNGIK